MKNLIRTTVPRFHLDSKVGETRSRPDPHVSKNPRKNHSKKRELRRSVSKPRVARYHHTHRAPCSLRIRLSDNDKETTKGRIRPNFERRNRSRPANQASTPRAHPFHHAQNTETRYVSGIHTKKKTRGAPDMYGDARHFWRVYRRRAIPKRVDP